MSACRTLVYSPGCMPCRRNVLRGGLSKESYLAFTRVSKKTTEKDRQEQLRIEPGTTIFKRKNFKDFPFIYIFIEWLFIIFLLMRKILENFSNTCNFFQNISIKRLILTNLSKPSIELLLHKRNWFFISRKNSLFMTSCMKCRLQSSEML